ncbi:MAG: CD225/dispanin family protein [Mycobacterium sp.]
MTEQPPGPPSGNYPPPPPGGYPPPPSPQGGGYPPQRPSGYGAQPDNNLVWAILTTVFCCVPLGIVSIVKSTQVSGLWGQGRFAEAQQSADDAKKWAIWAAIIGAIFHLIWIIVYAGAFSNGMS